MSLNLAPAAGPEVVTLNAGQQAAFDAFLQFLVGMEKIFRISGPGGVGKTKLMGQLIDRAIPEYRNLAKLLGMPALYDEVVMTATTNKAAEELSRATGRPTSTIHSFMNLKVQDDYSTGKSRITKTRNFRVHENMVIFIDEASMIDTKLLNFIFEGTRNCKIVFVGDHCQLAPVMERISPIYLMQAPFYELTQPMRTDIPALQKLNDQLRETVKTNSFQPIQLVPGIIDLFDADQMQTELIKRFSSTDTNDRILAYTNAHVMLYNDFIREIRQLPHSYTVGERLINNNAIELANDMLRVEDEVTIVDKSDDVFELKLGLASDGSQISMQYQEAMIVNQVGSEFSVRLPCDRKHFLNLIKYFGNKADWPTYFDLKNGYPDLRPRDAATFHKAQGSTYDTVFIDLGNLSTCRDSDMVARMLYVACSRARKQIIFYGDLAPKYGTIVQ